MTPLCRAASTPDAVSFFPRGLVQAEGRARFSIDALLLAAFAAHRTGEAQLRAADLGAGCGVAGLGYLLRNPCASLTAIELDPGQAEAARKNALRLGLAERFQAQSLDLADISESDCPPQSLDLVLANPPYFRQGRGRAPAQAQRVPARMDAAGSLAIFLDAAAWLLKNRGRACLVFTAARLPELLAGLRERRLEPKHLLPLRSRGDEAAKLVLVEARRNAGEEFELAPDLVLYEGRGDRTQLRAEALEFCPFLACNAGPRAEDEPV